MNDEDEKHAGNRTGMSVEQRQCFKAVYDFIHDERHACANLIALIDVTFHEGTGEDPVIGDFVGELLRKNINSYLVNRQLAGAKMMDLMYSLDSVIKRRRKN